MLSTTCILTWYIFYNDLLPAEASSSKSLYHIQRLQNYLWVPFSSKNVDFIFIFVLFDYAHLTIYVTFTIGSSIIKMSVPLNNYWNIFFDRLL